MTEVNDKLIKACLSNNHELALELIKSGESDPEQIDSNGNSALICACQKEMSKVALELIKTGKSKPEQVNNNGYTALIWACKNEMKEVALELIKTGKSNSGEINKDGDTALIWACFNSMEEVALEIIKTGQSNLEHENKNKENATYFAKINRLNNLLNVLKFYNNLYTDISKIFNIFKHYHIKLIPFSLNYSDFEINIPNEDHIIDIFPYFFSKITRNLNNFIDIIRDGIINSKLGESAGIGVFKQLCTFSINKIIDLVTTKACELVPNSIIKKEKDELIKSFNNIIMSYRKNILKNDARKYLAHIHIALWQTKDIGYSFQYNLRDIVKYLIDNKQKLNRINYVDIIKNKSFYNLFYISDLDNIDNTKKLEKDIIIYILNNVNKDELKVYLKKQLELSYKKKQEKIIELHNKIKNIQDDNVTISIIEKFGEQSIFIKDILSYFEKLSNPKIINEFKTFKYNYDNDNFILLEIYKKIYGINFDDIKKSEELLFGLIWYFCELFDFYEKKDDFFMPMYTTIINEIFTNNGNSLFNKDGDFYWKDKFNDYKSYITKQSEEYYDYVYSFNYLINKNFNNHAYILSNLYFFFNKTDDFSDEMINDLIKKIKWNDIPQELKEKLTNVIKNYEDDITDDLKNKVKEKYSTHSNFIKALILYATGSQSIPTELTFKLENKPSPFIAHTCFNSIGINPELVPLDISQDDLLVSLIKSFEESINKEGGGILKTSKKTSKKTNNKTSKKTNKKTSKKTNNKTSKKI